MFRTVHAVLKKYPQILQYHKKHLIFTTQSPRFLIVKSLKFLLSTKLCCSIVTNQKPEIMDVTESLHKALEEGEIAILKLMDQLNESVKVVSEEYRNCLQKEIEITQTASSVGQLSEIWDELPHYRNLASELLKEINEYMTLFNTIEEMAKTTVVKDNTSIKEKFKELEEKMHNELEENKKLEMKLLRLTCDCIINENI